MVAYSFKQRFVEQIIGGTKCQTIRAVGKKRHARVGEMVQLYTGSRFKPKKIMRDVECVLVEDIRIFVPKTSYIPCHITIPAWSGYCTDIFAINDGFSSIEDFTDFWINTHGHGEFNGVWIKWSGGA